MRTFTSIALAGAFAFYATGSTSEKVLVVNNTGYDTVAIDSARYLCDNDTRGKDWWHNVYWGGWWQDGRENVWAPFTVDLKTATVKAAGLSQTTCGTPLPTSEIRFWGAFLGPEAAVGAPPVTFDVRNLRLETQQPSAHARAIASVTSR